jgi:hypothetical protein
MMWNVEDERNGVEAGKKEDEEAGVASSKLFTNMQNTIHGLERSGKVRNKNDNLEIMEYLINFLKDKAIFPFF